MESCQNYASQTTTPSSTTCLSAESHADNWFGVEDARKRKQIQDRLAQRARRKRLSNTSNKAASATVRSSKTYASDLKTGQEAPSESAGVGEAWEMGADDPSLNTCPLSIPELAVTLISASPPPVTAIGRDHLLPLPSLTVYAALYLNCRILGNTCSSQVPSKSSPAIPTTPLPLHPTPLQLTTIHHGFIDNFPFPRLRDNMICLSRLIDEEEFLGDLFMMPSFVLLPGSASWDPQAWKIGDEFKAKWGYLFF